MFGTLGFSELIIILAIILIIFGAGRLPQIGEGLGKALKGFKKEVHEAPPPLDPNENPNTVPAGTVPQPPIEEAQVAPNPQAATQQAQSKPTAPYQPGSELTPGTTAAIMAAGLGPQPPQAPRPRPSAGQSAQPITMEDRQAPQPASRGVYPPLPPTVQTKTPPKRPSAVVNKDAVARVQAQQAAMKARASQSSAPSPQDMQSLGEGLGDALRTFRQAVADVRGSIDPEMRTIQAELDAAQKEIEQSVEAAKQMPAVEEDPPKAT